MTESFIHTQLWMKCPQSYSQVSEVQGLVMRVVRWGGGQLSNKVDVYPAVYGLSPLTLQGVWFRLFLKTLVFNRGIDFIFFFVPEQKNMFIPAVKFGILTCRSIQGLTHPASRGCKRELEQNSIMISKLPGCVQVRTIHNFLHVLSAVSYISKVKQLKKMKSSCLLCLNYLTQHDQRCHKLYHASVCQTGNENTHQR